MRAHAVIGCRCALLCDWCECVQTYAGTAIANLLLMAHCTHFVGGFGSHFARLAFELAVGLGSLQAPPRVVDIPWTST